jgi:hypothetical protein
MEGFAKEGATELQQLLKTFDPENPNSALGRIALSRGDLTDLWNNFQTTVVRVTQGPVIRSPQAAGVDLGSLIVSVALIAKGISMFVSLLLNSEVAIE